MVVQTVGGILKKKKLVTLIFVQVRIIDVLQYVLKGYPSLSFHRIFILIFMNIEAWGPQVNWLHDWNDENLHITGYNEHFINNK